MTNASAVDVSGNPVAPGTLSVLDERSGCFDPPSPKASADKNAQ